MEIKIPFYNILNMFLTGLVFLGGCVIIFPEYTLAVFNNGIIKNLGTGPEIIITICAFAAAYEVGLIINRAGSVIIEPILKYIKLIPFNDNYVLFNEKKKEYPIMSTLSREYALSRTGIALFLALLILASIACEWTIAIACAVITLVYYLSCRKHSSKIVELMEGKNPTRAKKG
ncbi:MAG: hypothetical protein PUC58_03505 [Oscillospiraceae bacterium]|nr:hypothetical protein [Oscillospiraceae bacterium]